MTCLTVTPDTAAEAIERRAEVIVSHHPVLFRAVKAIRADQPATGFLWELARAGVAILSPHTAFDNTAGGINDGLAERIGLRDVGPLRTGPTRQELKVVVFVPENDREAVMAAAFQAGAGRIGDYSGCSFATAGQGTFLGGETTNPTLGERGRRESVAEWRVEMVCPERRLEPVLSAIRTAHSYEEPALDVYPLNPVPAGPGSGRIGRLQRPEPLGVFARRVGDLLRSTALRFAGNPSRDVERVAICCGAGDDFLDDAARARADVLLTGEARFHRALEAEGRGIGLIVAGHHATERPGVEDLARRVAAAFPGLDVWPSRARTRPLATALTEPEYAWMDRHHEKTPGRAGGFREMARSCGSFSATGAEGSPLGVELCLRLNDGLRLDLRLGLGLRLDRVGGLAGAVLASGARDRQVRLMNPLASPDLALPALQRDRLHGRPVLVADHFTPGAGIGRAHLGRAAADA